MKKLLLVGIAMYWAAIAAWVWPQNIVKEMEDLRRDPLLSNRSFLASLEKLDSYVRVADEPFLMHAPTAEQCVVSNHVDVHGDRFCDVYVSKEGEAAIREGKAEILLALS